jgi:hypothetical protein
MTVRHSSITLLLVVLGQLLCVQVAVGQALAVEDKEFLRELRLHFDRIYTCTSQLYLEFEIFQADESASPLEKFYDIIYAYDATRLRMETYHYNSSPLVSSSSGREHDPIRNILVLRDGIRLHEWPNLAYVQIGKFTSEPLHGLLLSGYLTAFGIPDPDQRRFFNELPDDIELARKALFITAYDYFLPFALRDPSWRILKTEVLDGRECVVLQRSIEDKTIDQLWVDTALHYAIRRRRIEETVGGETEYLELRFYNFEVHSENLPIPKVIHVRRSEPPRRLEYRLSEVRFGERPEETFEIEVKPGYLIRDNLRGKYYLLPGGEEVIEQVVDRMKSMKSHDVWKTPHTASTTIPLRHCLSFFPSVLLVVSLLIMRSRRQAAKLGTMDGGE